MNIKACLLAIPFLLFAFNAQAALTDAEKCGVKKAKAIDKYVRCLDKNWDRWYSAPAFSDKELRAAEAIAKCHERCKTKMASAEKNGLCEINDDATNGAVCGPNSTLDVLARCRYNKTRSDSCTYPPP